MEMAPDFPEHGFKGHKAWALIYILCAFCVRFGELTPGKHCILGD